MTLHHLPSIPSCPSPRWTPRARNAGEHQGAAMKKGWQTKTLGEVCVRIDRDRSSAIQSHEGRRLHRRGVRSESPMRRFRLSRQHHASTDEDASSRASKFVKRRTTSSSTDDSPLRLRTNRSCCSESISTEHWSAGLSYFVLRPLPGLDSPSSLLLISSPRFTGADGAASNGCELMPADQRWRRRSDLVDSRPPAGRTAADRRPAGRSVCGPRHRQSQRRKEPPKRPRPLRKPPPIRLHPARQGVGGERPRTKLIATRFAVRATALPNEDDDIRTSRGDQHHPRMSTIGTSASDRPDRRRSRLRTIPAEAGDVALAMRSAPCVEAGWHATISCDDEPMLARSANGSSASAERTSTADS